MISRSLFFIFVYVPVMIVGIPCQFVITRLGLGWNFLPRLFHKCGCIFLGVRVTMLGEPAHGRPTLLLSNHISWNDIIVVGSKADVTFVAKSGVKETFFVGLLPRRLDDGGMIPRCKCSFDDVGEVLDQLAVLGMHDVGIDLRGEAGPAQCRRYHPGRIVGTGRVAAEVEDAGVGLAERDNFARGDEGRWQYHRHGIDIGEAAKRKALVGHPVLGADDRLPGDPGGAQALQGERRILRLHRQNDDVVGRELDLFRIARGTETNQFVAFRRAKAEAGLSQRLELRPARNPHHFGAAERQLGGDHAADGADAVHHELHTRPLRPRRN